MNFFKYLLLATLKFSNSFNVPRNVFKKVSYMEMINTFKVLKIFSLTKSSDENVYKTNTEYFQNCAKQFDKGIRFVKATEEKCTYLAWCPLAPMYNKTFAFDEQNLIIRNDCEGTDFKLIPLYYIILTVKEDKVEVDRIFPNPAIELRLDLKLLKKQLDQLTEISKTPIDYSKLKYYDNGRYFYEFSENRPGWSNENE
ncbi:hypothetical protein JO84_gp087 [Aureococcus anophagefferens virus]|uniref:Uncharacterized protein n=1 Tax=Aureococcus anophagefferens virus TaxID=1474867 RepID=A0A076FFG5_9VIRU|nr:hypothetical protein JO84_gp087 [Aureococcus anophagefferens virus]AII16984.1 hypothetical protein AaV_087 [Aureococcus anophagefferens virus]UOG94387.1 hypothetical protein MKD35_352 [Aureococcus anophagefferens virus]